MVTLVMRDCGSVCKIVIKADELEELEFKYNELYNWGCSGGSLSPIEFINGRFVAYIWSNKKNIIRYYMNLLENRYALKTGNEPENGELFQKMLYKKAEEFFKNIDREGR